MEIARFANRWTGTVHRLLTQFLDGSDVSLRCLMSAQGESVRNHPMLTAYTVAGTAGISPTHRDGFIRVAACGLRV